MAKVQLQGDRLGFEFQGQTDAPVTYSWLDSEGVAVPGPLPVIELPLGATTITVTARLTNTNDVAKVFSSPTGSGPTPVTAVTIAAFTVPANGTADVEVGISFDGTQQHLHADNDRDGQKQAVAPRRQAALPPTTKLFPPVKHLVTLIPGTAFTAVTFRDIF